jgi:hypothetical protein
MVWVHINFTPEEIKIVNFWKINYDLNTQAEAVRDIIEKKVK